MISWAERAKQAIGQKGRHGTAKTDETQVVGLLAVLSVPPPTLSQNCDLPIEDPDRWCWPHSSVMNGAEIERLTTRLQGFIAKGLPDLEAEALADQWMRRDRYSGTPRAGTAT
jgi:hypothetical protein